MIALVLTSDYAQCDQRLSALVRCCVNWCDAVDNFLVSSLLAYTYYPHLQTTNQLHLDIYLTYISIYLYPISSLMYYIYIWSVSLIWSSAQLKAATLPPWPLPCLCNLLGVAVCGEM